MSEQTKTERRSDRELVVTRVLLGPAHLVYRAWTTPELMLRWWVPKSFGMTFLSCEIDARVGGSYQFVFAHPQFPEPMAFFGRYLDVVPNTKLVWTNEESAEASVTTLTFDEKDGKTTLTLHELYPSKESLDEALESGAVGAYPEQFAELEAVLRELGEAFGPGRSPGAAR